MFVDFSCLCGETSCVFVSPERTGVDFFVLEWGPVLHARKKRNVSARRAISEAARASSFVVFGFNFV